MNVSRPVHVLQLTARLGHAGTERAMLGFCTYLPKDQFALYAAAYGEGGDAEERLSRLGIPYIIGHFSISPIVEFAIHHRIDVVHIHRSGHPQPFETELLQALKQALPTLCVLETNIFGFFDPTTSSLIDCHMVVSEMMLFSRYIKAAGYYDPLRMKVLHNPIDASYFLERTPSESAQIAYRKKLGLRDGDFVIGRLGRPDVSKWSDLLFEMMPYLVRRVPNTKFIIQAVPENRLHRVVHASFRDHVICLPETGDDNDIALFYTTIDVLAHSSKIGESFGMTLAEAGIYKKPVVVNSTPHKDNNQIDLIDHLKTGIIANHPRAFAEALTYLYEHKQERQAMGEAAYRKITTLYNPERIANQLADIMTEQQLAKINQLPFQQKDGTQEVEAYKRSYTFRLTQEFTPFTWRDVFISLRFAPLRLYYKIYDLLLHRFGFFKK